MWLRKAEYMTQTNGSNNCVYEAVGQEAGNEVPKAWRQGDGIWVQARMSFATLIARTNAFEVEIEMEKWTRNGWWCWLAIIIR